MINVDLKDVFKIFGFEFVNVVFINLFYRKVSSGIINLNIKKVIVRYEIMCIIEDVVRSVM